MSRLDERIAEFVKAATKYPLEYRYNYEAADRLAELVFEQAREDELAARVSVPPDDEE